MKNLKKIIKPSFFKIMIWYVIFFLLLTVNDGIYWCFINKSKEYCRNGEIYFLSFFMNLLSPWNIFTRIATDILIENIGDILIIFLFAGISYFFSCFLTWFRERKSKKRLKKLK